MAALVHETRSSGGDQQQGKGGQSCCTVSLCVRSLAAQDLAFLKREMGSS